MQTVLLVDDDPHVLDVLRAILARAFPAIRIRTAASGEEALKVLGEAPVSVIVCDERMPGMSGVETLVRARKEWPDVSAVMVSGFVDFNLVPALVNDAHVRGLYPKPVPREAFVSSVRALLEERTGETGLTAIPERGQRVVAVRRAMGLAED